MHEHIYVQEYQMQAFIELLFNAVTIWLRSFHNSSKVENSASKQIRKNWENIYEHIKTKQKKINRPMY